MAGIFKLSVKQFDLSEVPALANQLYAFAVVLSLLIVILSLWTKTDIVVDLFSLKTTYFTYAHFCTLPLFN